MKSSGAITGKWWANLILRRRKQILIVFYEIKEASRYEKADSGTQQGLRVQNARPCRVQDRDEGVAGRSLGGH